MRECDGYCWIGRAIFVGLMAGGFLFGVGTVYLIMGLVTRGQKKL